MVKSSIYHGNSLIVWKTKENSASILSVKGSVHAERAQHSLIIIDMQFLQE